ncbi:MAG: YlmC/YmxH family sporulation protein [Oscillospiraceae bacterium]|jgi:YlmC/YmxH family sporulation protein|nr:YlmC/YmxH family sporulation protein [Oscillospiraceae bacterium]
MGKWQVTELRCKEVINEFNGERLGLVGDVAVDTETGQIVALVLFGRPRWCGLFGRDEDLHIPWCDVRVVGEETVLVCLEHHHANPEPPIAHYRKDNFWRSFFR